MDSQFLPNRTLNEFTTNKSCVLEKTEILVDVKTGEKRITVQQRPVQLDKKRESNSLRACMCIRQTYHY